MTRLEIEHDSLFDCSREVFLEPHTLRLRPRNSWRQHLVHFDLDLDLRGTPFQLRVWDELQRIPQGEVRTYGELAASLGQPGAGRAVGGANGRNPIPLIVPCHRVVASDGLGGFTGGLEWKERLLAHEGVLLPVGA